MFLLGVSVFCNLLLFYYFFTREKGVFSKKHRQEIKINLSEIIGGNDWIVLLGNSLIERNDWISKYPDKNIANHGIGGDTVDGIIKRITNTTKLKPEKLFLLIGINDMRYGYSTDEIISDYNLLIQSIKEKSPYTDIYIQSILPVMEGSQVCKNVTNQEIITLNRSLKRIADIYEVQFIDLYSFFTFHDQLNPNYTSDGLHLNESGYKLWENIINGFVY